MPEPTAPPLERILARPQSGARSIVDLALGRDPDRPPVTDSVRPPSARGELTRRIHNRPLKVPRTDWVAVISGGKPMYRTYADSWRDRHARMFPEGEIFPRPVVLYSQTGHAKRYDTALAIVTAYRQEPLGAISAQDLRAEGFARELTPFEVRAGMRRFRRYWRQRYSRWGWRPDDLISVVELRPWTEVDNTEQATWLLRRLYGDWLPYEPVHD